MCLLFCQRLPSISLATPVKAEVQKLTTSRVYCSPFDLYLILTTLNAAVA